MSACSGSVLAGGDGTRHHERLVSFDLSRQVLQAAPESRAVLPVSGVGWSDLGDAARVRAIREQIGWELASA